MMFTVLAALFSTTNAGGATKTFASGMADLTKATLTMPAKIIGRRRSSEEIHEICHGASSEVQMMFRQTLAILAGAGSNQEPLVSMADEVREWCQTLPEETGARRQCQGYTGLLIEFTKFDDEHPASVMLVGAYGDFNEQENACGLIVRTINQALFEGHFEGLAVTQTMGHGFDYLTGEFTENMQKDIVVAPNQQRVEEVAGTAIAELPLKLSLGAAIGSAVITTCYMLIEICHDYDTLAALAPF